jgi:hypothetical protein
VPPEPSSTTTLNRKGKERETNQGAGRKKDPRQQRLTRWSSGGGQTAEQQNRRAPQGRRSSRRPTRTTRTRNPHRVRKKKKGTPGQSGSANRPSTRIQTEIKKVSSNIHGPDQSPGTNSSSQHRWEWKKNTNGQSCVTRCRAGPAKGTGQSLSGFQNQGACSSLGIFFVVCLNGLQN